MAQKPDWWYEKVRPYLNFLSQRKRAYQQTFASPVGKEVLADLAKFCRANDTCFNPNHDIGLMLEGRREVWLRIQSHLGLSPEQLVELFDQGHAAIPRSED